LLGTPGRRSILQGRSRHLRSLQRPTWFDGGQVRRCVVVDLLNHVIRSVTKEDAVVSTLAGGRQEDDE
jgi:hypothetical protein